MAMADFDAPWGIDLEGHKLGRDIDVVSAGGTHVALVVTPWPYDDRDSRAERDAVQVAHAHLIKASPDLLAACLVLLAAERGEATLDEALALARAALDKAKGA